MSRLSLWQKLSILIGCGIGYLLLMLWAPLPGQSWLLHQLEHEYQVIGFEFIGNRLQSEPEGSEAIPLRLFDYVRRHIYLPEGAPVIDDEPMDILVRGIGWCDQQSNVLVSMAARAGYDARLVFLKDASGSSPHSVAEIFMDGDWRVFDPLFGLVMRNPETGLLATREDLANHPELITDHPRVAEVSREDKNSAGLLALPSHYKNTPEIFNTKHARQKPWLFAIPQLVRDWLLWRFQDVYLMTALRDIGDPVTKTYLTARHHHLWYRYGKAKRGYERVIEQKESDQLAEQALFFSGLLSFERDEYEEAIGRWRALLARFPNGPWSATTQAALGEAAKAVGEYQQTETHYRNLGTHH